MQMQLILTCFCQLYFIWWTNKHISWFVVVTIKSSIFADLFNRVTRFSFSGILCTVSPTFVAQLVEEFHGTQVSQFPLVWHQAVCALIVKYKFCNLNIEICDIINQIRPTNICTICNNELKVSTIYIVKMVNITEIQFYVI